MARSPTTLCRQPVGKLMLVIVSFLTGSLVAILISPRKECPVTVITNSMPPTNLNERPFEDLNRTMNDRLTKALDRISELESILVKHGLVPDKIQRSLFTRKLTRDFNQTTAKPQIENHLTVLMYSVDETTACLKHRLDTAIKKYPAARLIVSSNLDKPSDFVYQNLLFHPKVATEGGALALMTSEVKTKYFLYLSSSVQVAPEDDDHSVSWLYHALETIPELDFVGGSFLREEANPQSKYAWLEVPCHRLRLCKWTMSQSMEYRYSVGDMMVCEETSQSFMGRAESLKKVPGGFDKALTTMATTDFFLRAKDKSVVVGLRPEVFFYVSKTCAVPTLSKDAQAKQRFPFMQKHQLYRIHDSFGEVTRTSSVKTDIVHWKHHTFLSPDFIEGLGFNLKVADDFFNLKNITYFIDAGVALGAIKLRTILPWDAGDIDTGFFADWAMVKRELEKYCRDNKIKAIVKTAPMSQKYKELMLFAGNNGVNTMFPQPPTNITRDMFMDVFINGHRYPISRLAFRGFRDSYGMSYLEMHGYHGSTIKCTKPGHHACLPDEFGKGGGNWREFYCQL